MNHSEFKLLFQASPQRGKVASVCNIMHFLRCICSYLSLVSDEPPPRSSHTLSKWAWLDKTPHRHKQNLLEYDPFQQIHLDSLNLVFLKQELTTTGTLNEFKKHPLMNFKQLTSH